MSLSEQDLKGKVAVITGGGRGIGRAVAADLAAAGMRIVLLGGRNADQMAETVSLVEQHSSCLCLPGDITDLEFARQGIETAARQFGRIDVLINNAGMALSCPFDEVQESQFDRLMEINVKVPFFLCQTALPYLKASGRGTIINISSVVGHQGYALQSAYAASKHAVLGFTQSLAKEVYRDGVRVHAISPGGVYTDMVKIARPDLTGEGMIRPEEMADIVHFLIAFRGNAVIDEINVHRVSKEPFL